MSLPNEMRISVHIGYYAAGFCGIMAVLLVLLSWRQCSFASLPICAGLLLVHPAWSMDVFSGDCGYVRRLFSVGVSLLFVALFVLQLAYAWFRLFLTMAPAYWSNHLAWQELSARTISI
jgi:hypothetical protein